MGAGRCVHPQDPAKARWLVGSSALLSGLLLFLLLPPLLFSHVEGWSYVEGFYFSFITLSTVGFGDFVIGENPQREAGEAPSTHLPVVRVPGHLLRARPCKGLEAQSPEDAGFGRFNLPLWCDRAKVTQLKVEFEPCASGCKPHFWLS